MLASDALIEEMMMSGRFCLYDEEDRWIRPEDAKIQPASVDLHLGGSFLRWKSLADTPTGSFIRYRGDNSHLQDAEVYPQGEYVFIQPGEHALACTAECMAVGSDVACKIEGRSSVGRVGLMVHSTAGWIDPGFEGYITYELHNVTDYPIRVRVGDAISQVCVFQLDRPTKKPYGHPDLGSRYQHQKGATAAKE